MSTLEDFGRDDGIKCQCGGKTFLVFDQGHGLRSYDCEKCGETVTAQFDWDDWDGEEDDYLEPPDSFDEPIDGSMEAIDEIGEDDDSERDYCPSRSRYASPRPSRR